MLRRLLLASALAAFLPHASLASVLSYPTSANPDSFRIQLKLGAVDIQQSEDGFSKVTSRGLVPIGRPGFPDLASTGSLLIVPPGTEPRIKVVSESVETIDGVEVQPCQVLTRCELPPSQRIFSFNSALYDSDVLYPAKNTALEELGQMQGARFVRVAFYPLQMQMKSRALRVTREMVVEVTFQKTARAKPVPLSPTLHALATGLTPAPRWSGFVPSNAEPERMLIIAGDTYTDAIGPLVTWKRERGIHVDVFTATQAGTTKEKIKVFIQKYYDESTVKPTYLLIVGNNRAVPGFKESTSMGRAATDYTYALLDGKDDIPDLLYGRFLADNESEVRTQVDRTVAYEKQAQGDWLSNGTAIASNEGWDPSDEDYATSIASALTSHDYRAIDTFFQSKKTATASNVLAALKQGRSWLAYIGHGSGESWSSFSDGAFNLYDMKKVDNADRLPFIVDASCLNGSWINMWNCFGKAWTSLGADSKPRGALAYYAGSVSVSWHEPAVMSTGIAKYHFEKPVYSIGASVFAGQMYLMEQMGHEDNTVDNLKWFNLFGDPSLYLRTRPAQNYAVALQALGNTPHSQVAVRVTDAFGEGIAGVMASAYADGDSGPAGVGMTNKSGVAYFTLSGSKAPQGMRLTTFGHNLETYQFTID